jgi:hypothetical protein
MIGLQYQEVDFLRGSLINVILLSPGTDMSIQWGRARGLMDVKTNMGSLTKDSGQLRGTDTVLSLGSVYENPRVFESSGGNLR